MLIYFLKFVHLVFALSLLGLTIYGFMQIQSAFLNRLLLWLVFLATLTGTLLIYPKLYTFHTPWIKAAYVLVIVFSLSVLLLKKIKKISHQRWIFLLLIMLLITVIHDAVTKTTFLLS